VSIIPGIDTGAPERTDTSSGRGPAPKRPIGHRLEPADAGRDLFLPDHRESGPHSRKAAHARVVITKLGGTVRPRALIRAIDQALPPSDRAAATGCLERNHPATLGPCSSACSYFRSLAAEDAQ